MLFFAERMLDGLRLSVTIEEITKENKSLVHDLIYI